MCSKFIHLLSTFFIRLIFIDFPEDKDKSSTSFRNLKISELQLFTM